MDETTSSATAIAPRVSRSSRSLSNLKRPCPVCGNSSRKECKRWCAIPEFEVLRCARCGVVFINEIIADNLGFGADPEVAEDPALASKAARDFKHIKQKLPLAGYKASSSLCLLDVGCGMGTFLMQGRSEGWRVIGLELSEAEAAYAREQRGLTVHECSIESATNFPCASFDVVTMFGVIEHLADPRGATEECARILRPNGILVIQTPAEDGLMRRVGRLLYWASAGLITFQVKQLYQMGGGHSVCFNRHSVTELMHSCGFSILSIEPSTYGLGLLMMRFRGMSWPKKFVYSAGTTLLFSLGKILGSNHMTIYAQKRDAG